METSHYVGGTITPLDENEPKWKENDIMEATVWKFPGIENKE